MIAKYTYFLIIIILLLSGANMGLLSKIFGKAEKAPAIYYTMVFKAYNIHVAFSVNGNIIKDEDYEFSGTGSRPINEWLIPGNNSLNLKLSAVDKSKEDRSFDLIITKAIEGQYAYEGEELWHFNYDYKDTSKSLPLELTKTIDMKSE